MVKFWGESTQKNESFRYLANILVYMIFGRF